MRRISVIAGTVLLAVVSAGTAVATGAAAQPTTTSWVVDRDRAQCARADFTSIQAAVDAAQPGDLIRVCPDRYSESVVIDKPLTIKGDRDAIEAFDCLQPAVVELGVARHAIVDPADADFSIAFALRADDIVLQGFVIEGAAVGIDASDRFSGYRIHHNLIRHHTRFAIDLGSEGTHKSRVDHNCIRDNRFGLVSELDDDSLSSAEARGEWNARDLINARIDHNTTLRNGVGCCGDGLEATGPGRRDRVRFDHNSVHDEVVGIALQNATRSAIVNNEISAPTRRAIFLGGANDGLLIGSNTVRGTPTATGIRIARTEFVDVFDAPSRDLRVTGNDVRGAAAGIYATATSLVDSKIVRNITSDNSGNGINMFSSDNLIRDNQSNNNVVAGITAFPQATGNRFEYNSMHGNGSAPGASFPPADARDLHAYVTGTFENVWIGNDCDTDLPTGTICGDG